MHLILLWHEEIMNALVRIFARRSEFIVNQTNFIKSIRQFPPIIFSSGLSFAHQYGKCVSCSCCIRINWWFQNCRHFTYLHGYQSSMIELTSIVMETCTHVLYEIKESYRNAHQSSWPNRMGLIFDNCNVIPTMLIVSFSLNIKRLIKLMITYYILAAYE